MANGLDKNQILINKERLIREFMHLVSYDSESFGERQIADYVKGELTKLGLAVEEDDAAERLSGTAGNIYGFLPGNLPKESSVRPVLLSSHLDTVKPGIGKKAVRHEDGRITSDGKTVLGADDAAGLAEIIEVLRVIKESDLPHPDIEVLFPVAEEPYAQGSRVFDYGRIKADTAYVLDMSGPVGRAAIAAPAIYSVTVRVYGKSAHAGFCPEDGIHAIRIAAEAIAEIRQGHIDETTTVNIGTIEGGTARNIVPELVTVTGEIRSMDAGKALTEIEKIRGIFEASAKEHGGIAEVDVTEEFSSYRIKSGEYVVTRFEEACKKLGLSGTLEETFGGSDNNHFTAHGIRGIVVANAMNEVHTTDEWTHEDELVRAAGLTLLLVTEKTKEDET